MLLFICNVAGARHAPAPSTSVQTTTTVRGPNCTHVGPLTFPDVVRDAGHFLSRPVDSAFELGRYIYYHTQGTDCVPPQSATEEVILRLADTGVSLLESALLGPEAGVIPAVGSGMETAGELAAGEVPSRSVLQDVLLSVVGLKTGGFEPPTVDPPPLAQLPPFEPGSCSIPIFGRAAQAITRRPALDLTRVEIGVVDAEGVHPYRDTVSGREGRAVQVNGEYFRLHAFTADGAVVEGVPLILYDGRYRLRVNDPAEEGAVQDDDPEQTTLLRCRRMPGAACSNAQYSPELAEVMRGHHARGLTEASARRRGIQPDPRRPGWFIRTAGNRRRHYLRFEQTIGQHVSVRYFPVKLHRLGNCTRLSVHLPHRGPAVVDIVRSPTTSGSHVITQGEYNVRFRGFASEPASRVYEHAIHAAPRVHLSQPERAAILRYYGDQEAALEAYLQRDEQTEYRRQELGAHAAELDRALLRVPAYAGRVYRGALMPTELLGDLEVGQMVRIPGFVRASGERALAMHQLEGRSAPGQTQVLLELQMRDGAHPVGLQTLRDEAEVIIQRGRIYKVLRNDDGVLELEEAGWARQAFGQGGAVDLRLG